MQTHSSRSAYYVVEEGIIREPVDLFPHSNGFATLTTATVPVEEPVVPPFKFGRLFRKATEIVGPERTQMIESLIALGRAMNATPSNPGDSALPAGYTYLGQFIAHEITFDKSPNFMVPTLGNWRSPQIDLDSLYGDGPTDSESAKLYEPDRVKLKIGATSPSPDFTRPLPNDLPRDATKKAILIDPRNDENLAVAQTHVAFISFHNKVVDFLKPSCPETLLFERARDEVVKHFQWLVLKDYLPRILNEEILDCVIHHEPYYFKPKNKDSLFMPLEFSVAAFRLGHSMVRNDYEWNYYHSSKWSGGRPKLAEIFKRTAFSGTLGSNPTLDGEWVIDWRRFYNFADFHYSIPLRRNVAKKIDPYFDLHLDQISGFPHGDDVDERKSITARNLLRGFALGLPTGEEVAAEMDRTPMSVAKVESGLHEDLLSTQFKGKTPLWYYILKEAEVEGKGERLGPVGSRIVAETLVGLIRHSRYSVLSKPDWQPLTSRRKAVSNRPRFEMADLLDIADVVDPLGAKDPVEDKNPKVQKP